MMSAPRACVSRGPSSRNPMRSELLADRVRRRLQRVQRVARERSPPADPAARGAVRGRDGSSTTGSAGGAAVGRGRIRHAKRRCDRRLSARGRPSRPCALTTCVERLPSTGGTAMPPRDRQVGARAAPPSSEPQARLRRPPGTASRAAPDGRPATIRIPRRSRRPRRSSSNSSSGPSSVTSSVAASRSLPTSALARRCDTGSIGPATGTPRD